MKTACARLAAALGLALLSPAFVPQTSPPPPPPPPLAPGGALLSLERVARELAERGRRVELEELFPILEALGQPAPARERLQRVTRPVVARAKAIAPEVPSAAKRLREVAKMLTAHLRKLELERRKELSRWILRLDDSQVEPHAMLDHVLVSGVWTDPGMKPLIERRKEIQVQVQEARRLEVKLEVGDSTLGVLREIDPRPGWGPSTTASHSSTPGFSGSGGASIRGSRCSTLARS